MGHGMKHDKYCRLTEGKLCDCGADEGYGTVPAPTIGIPGWQIAIAQVILIGLLVWGFVCWLLSEV